MRSAAFCAAVALAAPAVAGARPDASPRPTVYAAASLTDAFPRIDPRARFGFGGSNQLAAQLRQGAPADVFAAASPRYTQELYRARLVDRPVTFAFNELVLAVPSSNPAGIRSVFDLRREGIRLVVAAPAVPVGAYTREALRRLGLGDVLRKAVSREPDVKGVVGKVALGEADAGFVYATDAKAAAGRIRGLALPARARPLVRYEVAVVRASGRKAAARALVRRILGPIGRGVLSGAGFKLPKRRP